MGYLQMTRNVESIFGAVVTAPHQIPYTYTATGGETFISLPFYPVTGFITINSGVQVPVDNYVIDGNTVNLGRALETGDVVYCLFDKILSPEDYQNGIRIYKFQAVGNETTFTPDFTAYGVQSLYVDGKFQVPGVNYNYNTTTGVVSFLTGSPVSGVWVVAEMSVKQPNISPAFDRTIQEVARSANVTDDQVILSTDTTTPLDGKKVVYSVGEETSYGLPALPSGAVIQHVGSGQLTYNPGAVTVSLLPANQEVQVVTQNLNDLNTEVNNLSLEVVRRVLNLSALRQVSPTQAGQVLETYSAASVSLAEVPRGGGLFVSVAKGSLVDDGGYTILPAVDNGFVWKRGIVGDVWVDDFGAKADSSTDNATAISKAMLFGKNNQVVINFSYGSYLTSQTVPIYSWSGIRGQGQNKTQIAKTTNAAHDMGSSVLVDALVVLKPDVFLPDGTAGNNYATGIELSGVTLRREGITGRANAPAYGIYSPYAASCLFTDLRVECGNYGFWGEDCFSNVFTRCGFLGLGVGQYCGFQISRFRTSVYALSGTSNVLNQVGVVNYQFGFIMDSMQYSTLNSCTADSIAPMSGTSETISAAYVFHNPHGIVMNGCGSENVKGERIQVIQYAGAVYAGNISIHGCQFETVPADPLINSPIFRFQNDNPSTATKVLNVYVATTDFTRDTGAAPHQLAGYIVGSSTSPVKVTFDRCVVETAIISGTPDVIYR